MALAFIAGLMVGSTWASSKKTKNKDMAYTIGMMGAVIPATS